MSATSGAQFVPIGMPTVCWKTFPAKTTKILSTRNSSILMMSSSGYLFLESEYSFTKYVSSCPNTKYLYLRLPFLKIIRTWYAFWPDCKAIPAYGLTLSDCLVRLSFTYVLAFGILVMEFALHLVKHVPSLAVVLVTRSFRWSHALTLIFDFVHGQICWQLMDSAFFCGKLITILI